jgi:hypothetical protein
MKITIKNERSAILHARASASVIHAAKHLEGPRHWLKGGGMQFDSSQRNIDLLKELLGAEVDQAGEEVEAFDIAPRSRKYFPRTEPMPHQVRALEHIARVKNSALFMEQGTGKTWVALTRAGQLWAEGKITACIIITKKGVHRQWIEQQAPEHYGAEHTAAAWPSKRAGRKGDAIEFFSINIEAIRKATGKGRAIIEEMIEEHSGRILLIVDESHQIKSARSQQSVACQSLGRLCSHRMILTGTPIASNLEDEWAQLKFLDESIIGIRYVGSFRNEYCLMGGFQGKVVIGSKNVDRFKKITAPYCFRAEKEEIGLLPKRYSRWEFDLTKPQLKTIADAKNELRAIIQEAESAGKEVPFGEVGASLLQVQQISNGFLYDDTGQTRMVHQLFKDPRKNPRCEALGEILDAVEGPVIVWARFQQDIHEITRYLFERDWSDGFTTYYGETAPAAREQAVKDFIGGSVRLFIANPAAAGTGLNLQGGGCQNAIYYSNSDNSIERWQSEDRIHRIGMTGRAQYWDLIARRSADKAILRRLNAKKAFSQMVLSDINKELDDVG